MTERPRTQDLALTAAVIGATAGLVCAALDVASTVFWLAAGRDQWRLVFALASVGAGAGAAWGAGLAVGFSHRRRDDTFLGDATRIAWLLAVPLSFVAWQLFTGGRMQRLPARPVLRLAAFAALITVVPGLCAVLLRTARRARDHGALPRGVFFVAALGAAQALHTLDHRFLPRLYEYLHAALGIATWCAAGLGVYVLLPRKRPARRTLRLFAVAVSFASVAIAFPAMSRWENVRAEVLGVHAPFVRHIARAVWSLTSPDRSDTVAARRARLDRERRSLRGMRTAAGGPVLSGAHVVLVTIDALRDDRVGARGGRRSRTPELDLLASSGIRFSRTYAQAPHSSYSLSSLHTSEYLHETVQLGQAQPRTTMAGVLAREGYHTVALFTRGVFFTESERLLPYRDTDFGFRRADHVDRRAPAQTDAALREVDDVVRRGEPPSLLWVHYFDTHEPYGGDGRTSEARYDDAVSRVDREVGRLVRTMRARLARDVIVAVTADHGEEFGEHGGVYHGSTLYDEQVRVPWILSVPGFTRPASQRPAESIDIAPTLLGLVGVSPAAEMRGRDQRSAFVVDDRPAEFEPVFAAVSTRTMVVQWPWKLISDRRYGARELYDLATDPREQRNLADAEPSRVRDLDGALLAWIDSLGRSTQTHRLLARARLGDRSVAADLLDLAARPSAALRDRIDAVRALGDLGNPARAGSSTAARAGDASLRLRTLLVAAERGLADAAAIALGQWHDPQVVSRLRDVAYRDDPTVRAAAALALAEYRERAGAEVLEDLTHGGDETLRLAAIDAKGASRRVEHIETLIELLADDNMRYRAVLSLGRIGDARAFDAVMNVAQHDRGDDVRANAGAAVGMIRDPRAVAALVRLAQRDDAQLYAASALALVGGVGRAAAGWDARATIGNERGTWLACDAANDGPVWQMLGARACEHEGERTIALQGTWPSGPATLFARVRTTVPLALRLDGRTFVQIAARDDWQSVRCDLSGARSGTTDPVMHEVVVSPETRGRWSAQYVVVIPHSR